MKKILTLLVVLLATVCASADVTFPSGTVITLDATAYGDGMNVYIPGTQSPASPYTDWWESTSSKITFTLTSDWTVTTETSLFKSGASNWEVVCATTLPADNTCTTLTTTDGKTYSWSNSSPVEASYYLKTNFGGGSDWTWKQLTKDEGSDPVTYSLTAIYGGSGCNWNTSASDNGSTWVASPTLVGDPVSGDMCTFTFTPSTSNITITKVESTKFTLTVASAGNGNVWIDGSSETSAEVNEGAVVMVGATAADGYYFKNWTVDGVEVSKSHIYKRTVSATETLTANFTTEAPAMERVYFANTNYWGTVNVYVWGGDAGEAATWPGTSIAANVADFKYQGCTVYYFDAEPGAYANCIFNDGSYQTADLLWENNKCYVDDVWKAISSANMYIRKDMGCATFVAPFDVIIPDGVKAYAPYEIVDDSWLKMVEVTVDIPGRMPVLLTAENLTEDFTKDFAGVAESGEATCQDEGGLLIGNVGTDKIAVATGNYVLQCNNDVTGWYLVDGSAAINCGVNRCYMSKTPGARAFYGIQFGETTGISSIATEAKTKADGKYLVNGKIVVVKAGKAYNMNGQIVK